MSVSSIGRHCSEPMDARMNTTPPPTPDAGGLFPGVPSESDLLELLLGSPGASQSGMRICRPCAS